MRLASIVGTGTAALCLLAPLAAGSAAASGVHRAAQDQPMHVFDYARIVRTPSGPLSFRAKVDDYVNQPIDLMKKVCQTCAWHQMSARITNGTGRIASTVGAPSQGRWYWRYRVPASPGFRVSYSSTWYTFSH